MSSARVRLLVLVLASGCSVFGAASEDDGADPAGASVPPGQDPPALQGEPVDAELNESFGVFVSAKTGSPDGDGSRKSPLRTIEAGIARAREGGRRVYVCSGAYQETVTIENGISIVGGLDCSSSAWKTGGERSVLLPVQGPALRAKDSDLPTRVDSFEVRAPDSRFSQAPSSIALIAEQAGALTVARSKLIAGRAADGADGTEGVQLVASGSGRGADALPGIGPKAESDYQPFGVPYTAASPGGQITCQGEAGHDPEPGGASGRGGAYHCLPSGVGGNWYEYYRPTIGGVLGAPFVPVAPVTRSGAAGTNGSDGPSATGMGALTPEGYATGDGTAGGHGGPGKGGSGSGAQSGLYHVNCSTYLNLIYVAIGGAGGGSGGCPGLAGTPGKGGGASIAALLFASEGLTFDATELVAGQAGNGGKGTFGSQPTPGGPPGTSRLPSQAAAGGAGGRSGVSGSGAGGPSLGLAQTGGQARFVNGAKATAGQPGQGVPEQTNGQGKTIPASAAGPAADVHTF